MNDKEKKAIKRCYRRINELKLNFAITNEDLNAIEIILNLIENQKAEIEKKDKEIKCLKCLHNTQVEIIDLMAKELVKAHEWFYSEFDNYTKEDFIKYFENKAEEEK